MVKDMKGSWMKAMN